MLDEQLAPQHSHTGPALALSPRQQLAGLVAQDFEAFVLDCFREEYARYFMPSMDRVSKTNILLSVRTGPEIVVALEQWRLISLAPDIRQRNITNDSPSRIPSESNIKEQISQLYEQLRATTAGTSAATDILEAINSLRRRLRNGPLLGAGETIAQQRFLLLRTLGQGGYATVYHAFDLTNNHSVAVKVLHPQFSRESSHRERFYRGASRMRELNHPHIVPVLEEPQEDDGFHFFVMKYIDGGDLDSAVINKQIDLDQAIRCILQVGEALEFAHQRGMIHRDVKPANILLDNGRGQPQAYLSDFDLVWAADTTGGTRTGAMGTFMYAAPEALIDASRVDARTDVYSLAMTLIFVLYGKKLPPQALTKTKYFLEKIESASQIKFVLSKAIEEDATRRYTSMNLFCTAIRSAMNPQVTAKKFSIYYYLLPALVIVIFISLALKYFLTRAAKPNAVTNNRPVAMTAEPGSPAQQPSVPAPLPSPAAALAERQDKVEGGAPAEPNRNRESPLGGDRAPLGANQKTHSKTEANRPTTKPASQSGLGHLLVYTSPTARLYIDGNDTGLNTQWNHAENISVPIGSHQVRFMWSGQSADFQIKVGNSKPVEFRRDLNLYLPEKMNLGEKLLAEAHQAKSYNSSKSADLCMQVVKLFNSSPSHPLVQQAFKLIRSLPGHNGDDDF